MYTQQMAESQESISELFPKDSHFPDNVIADAYMPPETAAGDIEETAHVLNYTTPSRLLLRTLVERFG